MPVRGLLSLELYIIYHRGCRLSTKNCALSAFYWRKGVENRIDIPARQLYTIVETWIVRPFLGLALFYVDNRKGGSREILSIKETMKKWMSFLLAMLMLLGLGSAAVAAEENPVGVIAGNTYYNEALGIYMTLPDNWRFLSDVDLASQMGYDSKYASREGLATLLSQNSAACGMYAVASDTASNANLMVQDLGIYRSLDEATYLDLAKDSLTGALESVGYTDIQLTPSSFQLAGKEHVGAVLTGKLGFMEMHMIVVLIKGDRYMGSLTAASTTREKAEAVLAYFQPLSADTKVPEASSQASSGAGDAKAQYAQAKEAFEKKMYYTAYKMFTALGKYEDAASLASKCKRPTPETGELSRNSDYKRKTVRLNLNNKLKGGYNIYVRIYDSTGETFVSSAFVRSGKGAVVYLPDRSYLMKAAYSKGPWFGENEMFGDDAIYKELFTFSLEQVGRHGYWYCNFEDELNGTTVSREDF